MTEEKFECKSQILFVSGFLWCRLMACTSRLRPEIFSFHEWKKAIVNHTSGAVRDCSCPQPGVAWKNWEPRVSSRRPRLASFSSEQPRCNTQSSFGIGQRTVFKTGTNCDKLWWLGIFQTWQLNTPCREENPFSRTGLKYCLKLVHLPELQPWASYGEWEGVHPHQGNNPRESWAGRKHVKKNTDWGEQHHESAYLELWPVFIAVLWRNSRCVVTHMFACCCAHVYTKGLLFYFSVLVPTPFLRHRCQCCNPAQSKCIATVRTCTATRSEFPNSKQDAPPAEYIMSHRNTIDLTGTDPRHVQ